MPKFGLGERVRTTRECVTIDTGKVVHTAGEECVVVGLPGHNPWLPEWYRVEYDGDPTHTLALEWHLERIVGSWDEIERATGWRPPKSRRKTPERETDMVE